MTEIEIIKTYELIKKYHEKYLIGYGITLAELKTKDGFYIKDSLVLVYLARNYPDTNIVSKEELTQFVKQYYPDVNDVQQARHLSRQKGWYIISGQRGDITDIKILSGSYKLISLEVPYPAFTSHRVTNFTGDFWEDLKIAYNNRCASCGSPEGERNYINSSALTQLQKGHMDPEKPLEEGNIIPQCQECNRGDRNRWIYDKRGRVIDITRDTLFTKIQRINMQDAFIIIRFLKEKFKL